MGSFDDLIPGGSSQGGSGAFDDLIPKKSSLARRVLGDTGVSLLKGAVAVPEAAVGIADIVSGGLAGKYAEQAGFRPKEAKAALDEMYSPEQKAANQYVQEGDGFVDTFKRAIDRPSVIGQSVAESLPLLLPGAAAARGIGAATKVAPYIAGAAGEGLVGAGSAAEQLRQGSEDGTISGKQTLGALASGVGTAGFGALGGKLASSAIGKKIGISDIDTVLAGGASNPASVGLAKRALSGAVSEGVLEELPQSMWEQAAQNYATDKPLGEGVGQAGAMGLLAGTAMGGTFNAMQRGEQRKEVDDTKPVAEEVAPVADGLTFQPGLIPGVDVGEPKQATIPASDMPVVDFQKSPVYGPTAPVSRADGMQGIDFTPEPKLQETGPMSSAVNVGVDSGATSLRPQGSFSDMSEFANLLGQERQDVQSRRTGIAHRQALQREVALQDADQRVADQMAKEAAQRRRAVLDQVLSDPTTQNPADRFAAELQRQGFRDSTPTADELATVQRFNDIKAAQPAGPEIEPSLPNELDAEQLGIRSRKGSSGAQSSGRDKVAEVRQLVADGWKISNKTLVSPTGKKRILNTAEHAAAKEATRERNLAAMERYRQSKGKGTPVSTTNVASEETNAPEIEQLAPQAPQANDAQVESQPSAAPQAEGVAQPEPAVAQSDVEDYGKRVVRRNKPVSKWTAEEIQDRLARADSGESPISDESRSQLQAALEPLVAANKEKEAKAAEQAERVKKMQAAKAANKDTFQIGENKDSLERVSVRDGVVHLGDYPATDYNSGDDITVPDGATKQQVLDALIAGEAVTKKAKVWGKNGPEQSVADRIAELQAERDAMSKAAQKYADQVQSAIAAGEQEGISKAEVMADIGAKNEEVGQIQRSSQEGANGNDGSPGAATEGGREERDGDAQGQEREVTADGRVSSEAKQSKQDDKGAANFSFAGRSAATADKFALSNAEKRIDAGDDAEEVRKETGWFKGADGKWRFEIDDSDAKLKKPYPENGMRWGDMWLYQIKAGGNSNVGNMLDHPSLFAAYPSLADMAVSTKKGTGASLSVESRQIDIGEDVPMYEVASVLLHEIQHGIQSIEGFASGGSESSANSVRHQIDRLREESKQTPEFKKWAKEQDRIIDELDGEELDSALKEHAKSYPAKDMPSIDITESAHDIYRRLAGEVEARNTQSRQKLTAEQRRERSPSSTQDVSDSDVIVIFNGKVMQDVPMPANASRGQGSGMAFRDLQAVVDRVSKGFNNLPKIHVLDSPRDLSDRRDNERTLKEQIEQAGAMDDVEGAHHNGEIYLFASGIASEERAEHVLATHEITHYGLRGTMGKGLDSALQNIWLYNKEVRAKATVLRMQLGLTSNVSAVEEVLAEMKDSDLVKLKGWRKMVQAFRDWAHKAGFDRIAAKLDGLIAKGMSDQEKADLFVANMVNAARDWVRNGKPARGYDPGTSMLGDANFSAKKSDVTDTPAFRKWFGDSKVVDSDGKPIIVYHGSPDARFVDEDGVFATMKDRMLKWGNTPESKRDAKETRAFFFTTSKDVAKTYADDSRAFDYQNAEAGIVPAYVSINNPLVFDAGGAHWREAQERISKEDFIKKAKKSGHDGVIIKNVRDSYDSMTTGKDPKSDVVVAFESNQIKHAERNNGDFDASNPDIRFSRNKSASVDASITEIFNGLAGRGLKKQRAEERLAEHPQAESIRYVQDNILDILEELEGAGTIKINC